MRVSAAVLTITLLFGTSQSLAKVPDSWVLNMDESHGFNLSLMGIASLGGNAYSPGVGGGVLAGFALAPLGFSHEINDAFYLEIEALGAGRLGAGGFGYSILAAGIRYQLYLFDWMSLFLAARVGGWIPFTPRVNPWIYWTAGGGLMFHLAPAMAIRIEGGAVGLMLGVTWSF